MSSWLRFSLLLGVLCLPTHAFANGRFPASQLMRVGPGRDARVMAVRLTFGFAISDDGGCTFRWLCEQALGYAGPPYDPSFELAPDGALLLAMANGNETNGIARISVDRCSSTNAAEVRGQYVVDLSADPTGQTIVALTSNGSDGPLNRVWRSDDGGRTYRPLGAGSNELYTTLEIAPSNLQRVYLTAARNLADRERVSLFFRSNDGGATLQEMPFAAGRTLQSAYIAGIDPMNPDRVYVRGIPQTTTSDGGTNDTPGTVLLRTEDGGNNWSEVLRTAAAMEGFAISDDGRTIWAGTAGITTGTGTGGMPGELQRSTDFGARWNRVGNYRVGGLRYHQGVLYMAASDPIDGFAFGRSRDNGDHFEPLLRMCDLRVTPSCPNASLFRACEERWPIQRGPNNLACMAPPPPSAACTNTMDAGVPTDAGPPVTPPPCGCRTTAPRSRFGLLSLAVAALFLQRKRRAISQ